MKRRIAVIASSRATYGYKRKVINLINKSDRLELQLIVTGMHLLKEYGYSVKDIEADGFPIAVKVEMMVGGDTPSAWAKSVGVEIQNLAQVFSMLRPDIVLVTGDRAEMFAAAITASYMNIPVAHIQAGDVSGHIDGSARHAITKLSHIHFPSCEDSAKRVEKMGEEKWRIFNVGAPQLDAIIHDPKLSKKELNVKLGVDLNQPTILVLQHPILVENDKSYDQMKQTMEVIAELKIQTLVVYPNVDSGGAEIIRAIKEYENLLFIYTFRNVERQIFISLLKAVSVIVGNSSCGILEAPSFKLPAVNIGNRQRGRMQANNVINVPHKRGEIANAINKALFDNDFKRDLRNCINPYGDGKSSGRIVKILKDIELNEQLLDKKMVY